MLNLDLKHLLISSEQAIPANRLNPPGAKGRYFLGTLLIIIGGACAIYTLTSFVDLSWQIQLPLFYALNQELSVLPPLLWQNITELGDASILIPLVALLMIKNNEAWLPIIYATPIATIANRSLKVFFEMPRPSAVIDTETFNQVGEVLRGYNSLPSGHTTTVFTAIIALLCFYYPSPRNMRSNVIVGAGVGLAIFLSVSRIAVGAHWPLDVVLGAAIGSAAAVLGNNIYQSVNNRWAYALHMRLLGSFIPAILSITLIYRFFENEPTQYVNLISAGCGLMVSAYLISNLSKGFNGVYK